jgi:large subunit ribosomal protein L35
MGKAKTRKSAVKRFKVTKTGKLLHRGHGTKHLKSNKSKRRLRRMKATKEVTGVNMRKLKKMMSV